MLFQDVSHPGFVAGVIALKLVGVVLAPLGLVRFHVHQLLELDQKLLVDALPSDVLNLDRWSRLGQLGKAVDVGEKHMV